MTLQKWQIEKVIESKSRGKMLFVVIFRLKIVSPETLHPPSSSHPGRPLDFFFLVGRRIHQNDKMAKFTKMSLSKIPAGIFFPQVFIPLHS